MSKNYSKIKAFYEKGFYSIAQMRKFVEKGQITADEFKQITGEDYE